MATRMLRRGLPRVPGGDPWPPADAVAVEAADALEPSDVSLPEVAVPVAEPVAAEVAPEADALAPRAGSVNGAVAANAGVIASSSGIRRGLPRVPGGEPWPPVSGVQAPVADEPAAAEAVPTPASSAAASSPAASASAAASGPVVSDTVGAAAPVSTPAPAATPETHASSATGVRRGLPRVVGGEPWPPAGVTPIVPAAAAPVDAAATASAHPVAAEPPASAAARVPTAAVATVDTPLAWKRTVWDGRAPRHVAVAPEPARRRPTWTQAIVVLFGAAALGVLAGAAIALVRTLLSFPFMQDFLAAFPGEYEPAIEVAPGFAPWVNWAHFFNMFLMVLIIRSGLQVRTEKRPTVFWTPRGNAKGKISLNLWFHQALDILWLVNGVIFVVLLFVTGHWVRIVPTSWEVFPNALSAALQYVSFDWPHENGWNNYNSLQQLAYFATVFIAAPLAAITGFRMSGLWPKKAEKLSKAYPVEWARALHFPIMLYFVAFIIAHVALVMLTGFLRNLNHMFAAQDAATWTGFWVFVVSIVVIAIGWAAARPLVLAPIAKVFGKVSGR